ncbi:MAG: NAD(P)-binding domain-containing protein [Gammaproteobacteria bacterium]
MGTDLMAAATYALPATAILAAYLHLRGRTQRRSRATRLESEEAGLVEPPSLHPVIDVARCIGCASCVHACPEGNVLGLIGTKAELVNPTHCIGHGACREACPTRAISLVFGTARRGVDIPLVKPNFETNVPGIFIAGELGGMGLIRNAVEQGRQAIESVSRHRGGGQGRDLDVVIVGAGPAGISASLGAIERGLRYITVEQDSLGGTVAHFPRGKLVMTAPVKLPLVGPVRLTETTKEYLLEFWQGVIDRTGVAIRFQERVERIECGTDGFEVVTTSARYRPRAILLCIGRRGTPRTLDVPGEETNKVVYRLVDPEQYRGKRVLVVGGGDSALEAATSIADLPGSSVTLSYRGDNFSRAKQKNRAKVEQAVSARRMDLLLGSKVLRIEPDAVHLSAGDRSIAIGNDAVIVCAGGVLPTGFLKEIGIEVETKYGTA